MKQETRTVCFDPQLQIEASRFIGIMQKFPTHFHEHYVIGLIEHGKRHLVYNNQEYFVGAGDMLLFNPGTAHACEPLDGTTLAYRFLNIGTEAMRRAALELTGKDALPKFREPVLPRCDMSGTLRELHEMILQKETDFKKEELYFLLLEQLINDWAEPFLSPVLGTPSKEIKAVCEYLDKAYQSLVTLDELSALAGLSKYYLLRSFTKQLGISPYRYLQNKRIEAAKRLLETGAAPADAAFDVGFTDQSHFTKTFKEFTGLTPRQYRNIF